LAGLTACESAWVTPWTDWRDCSAACRRRGIHSGMHHFITTYHLFPQDALILAHAERLGVYAVATLDRDWRRASAFDVYTCL
jgi:predicted nucleic acid-binding protein